MGAWRSLAVDRHRQRTEHDRQYGEDVSGLDVDPTDGTRREQHDADDDDREAEAGHTVSIAAPAMVGQSVGADLVTT